jgi:hypothetical protein
MVLARWSDVEPQSAGRGDARVARSAAGRQRCPATPLWPSAPPATRDPYGIRASAAPACHGQPLCAGTRSAHPVEKAPTTGARSSALLAGAAWCPAGSRARPEPGLRPHAAHVRRVNFGARRVGARLPIRRPHRAVPERASVRPPGPWAGRTSSRVNVPHGVKRRTAGREARRIPVPAPMVWAAPHQYVHPTGESGSRQLLI